MTDTERALVDEIDKYKLLKKQHDAISGLLSTALKKGAELEKRLEQCEQSLARFQSGNPELGDLSFREQIRSEMITKGLKDSGRLEQCEAALKAERDRCELLAQYAGALGLARKIRNGKAAHAALEE